MATAPAFIVQDGNLRSLEALEKLGLHEGERLFLVSDSNNEIVLRRDPSLYMGMTVSEYMQGWRSMLGAMQDGVDTTEERSRQRAEEYRREQKRFGD